MEASTIQSFLDKALSDGSVRYEVSPKRQAIVLSIPEANELIQVMDDLWLCGKEQLIPLDQRGRISPIPTFCIRDNYIISPTFRQKRIRDTRHLYDFLYATKG